MCMMSKCRFFVCYSVVFTSISVVGCGEPTSAAVSTSEQSADVSSKTTTDSTKAKPKKPDRRAKMRLAELKPTPKAPASPAEPIAELSGAGQRRLERAKNLYTKQRFTESAIEIEKALRKEPNHPLLHRQIALAYRAIGNRERARTYLGKAAAANPDDVIVQYLLGRQAFEDQDRTEAIKRFRTAILCSNTSEAPDFVALSWFNLARALNADGYLAASIDAYRGYESAAKDATDGEYDHEYVTLRQINGGNAGEPISVLCEKLGRITEAADALKASFAFRKPDAAARERLARLLARDGRIDEALEQARQLFDDPERAADLLTMIHTAKGQPEAAIDDVRAIYEANPDNVQMTIAYADLLQRFDRPNDAKAVLDDAAERGLGENNVLQWRRADLAKALKDWRGLLATLSEAMREDELATGTCVNRILELKEDEKAVQSLFATDAGQLDHASTYLLGRLAGDLGEYEKAGRYFEASIEQKPDFVRSREELAQLALDRYEWQRVIEIAKVENDDGELTGSGRLRSLLGQAYAGLDNDELAEKYLSEAIAINRSDHRLRLALADFLRDTDQTNRALRQYEQVVQQNPLDEVAREALVDFYLSKDRRDDAVNQLVALKRLPADPHRIARCVAKIDLDTGGQAPDLDRFRETLQEAIDEHGPETTTIERLAESYIIVDEPEKALELLERIDSDSLPRTSTLELRFLCHRELIEYELAADLLNQLLERHPNRFEWIDEMIRLLFYQQRFDEAYALVLRQFHRENLSEDRIALYRDWTGSILSSAERHDELIEVTQTWLAADTDNDDLKRKLYQAYRGAEKHEDAIEFTRDWYSSDRTNQSAISFLTLALLEAERYDEAAQFHLDQLRNDPTNTAAQSRLVSTLTQAEKFDDALELIDNYFINRDELDILEAKSGVYLAAKRYDEAIQVLSDAIRVAMREESHNQSNVLLAYRMQLSAFLQFAGRYEDASAKLQGWVDASENDWERFQFLTRLAGVAQIRGQTSKGLDALEKAHDIAELLRSQRRVLERPYIGVNNDFGYSLADEGLRLDEAERMIRIALASSPGNGAYLDSYGWVFYKKGDFQKALKWLMLSAGSPQGNDPVVLDHVGDTLWQLNREAEAVDYWNRSIAEANERLEEEPGRPDLTNLLEKTQSKVQASESGGTPELAPLATPESD